mmetsp:Transcript_14026/g.20204  ORF Transcript_14026/g.20204 Transcript_14026/m.20204 type:complete len:126 (+) Transcript_14026:61-438(+)
MRALVRIDKNKGKKLKGPRKRKEESLAANIAGGDFRVDTRDRRFAAVLDGTDSRFGIDRTDPNYKETEAMREIIEEQTKRRKARKKQKIAPNVATTGGGGGAAAADLSSLVQSLKAKVAAKKKTS